ncbi:hypothetical protein [Lysinibacillus pakistanensis]|uniref:hypothetical protein n=1 Tax=Lysinibacillus pakistanensis TaxID=759811 RepID=UPI003D297F78
MKKIIISLCVFVLLFNVVSPALAAVNEPYDHKALMEYDGYGKAMYETMVDQTTFITGQYTSNKEYVKKSINQVKDYAKFWWDEAKELNHASLKDVVSAGGGYLLTIGDWFKKMFGGYEEKYHPPQIDTDVYNKFVILKEGSENEYFVDPEYEMVVVTSRGEFTYDSRSGYIKFGARGSWAGDIDGCTNVHKLNAQLEFSIKGVSVTPRKDFFKNDVCDINHWSDSKPNNFGQVMWLASMFDVQIFFKKSGVVVTPPVKPTNDDFDRFKKYLDEKLDKIATPQPKPYLVCPNGSKIQMSVSGSTFLSADGTTMIVNKDGTAEVNSEICKLNWDKPAVKYIDGRAAVETPDGNWQDAETGKKIEGNGGDDDDDECGMLCSLGKLAEFVLNFFEKLLEFFIKIFIPEDMDFITKGFDELKIKFDEKLSILKTMKDFFTNLFDAEQSPALDYELNLPAVGKPIKLMDMSLVAVGVPIMKKVISAVIVLYTVIHVYRKIVGDGGVMEK